jgi:hypothetical protein
MLNLDNESDLKAVRIKFREEVIKLFKDNNQSYFDQFGHYPPRMGPTEHIPLFSQSEMTNFVESFLNSLEKVLLETPKQQWKGGTKARDAAVTAADQCNVNLALKSIIGVAAEAGASPLEIAIIVLKFSEKTFSSVFIACAVKTSLEVEGKLARNQFISAICKACAGCSVKQIINAIEAEGISSALTQQVVAALEPLRKFFEEVYNSK